MLESVTTLPFNRHVGIQTSTTSEGLLELPSGEQFLNHLGTVHAGAQLALAEAASGEFLLRQLAKQSDAIAVVRRVEAKFRKPAHGRLVAKINTSATSMVDSLEDLATRGRCLIEIGVDLFDQNGEHTLAASFEWFVAKPR